MCAIQIALIWTSHLQDIRTSSMAIPGPAGCFSKLMEKDKKVPVRYMYYDFLEYIYAS